MEQETNPYAGQLILEAVGNQLQAGTPPKMMTTFERLKREGSSAKQAKQLIACVLAPELHRMVTQKQK